MPTVAPFGTWLSPIDTSVLTGAAVVNEVIVDAETKEVYYIQARPQEAGRCVVQTGWGKESKHVFGAGWNARSQVHEYGGAAIAVLAGQLFFSDAVSGRVWRVDVSSRKVKEPVAVTPDNRAHRYGDFQIHPTHRDLLVSILEDHTKPGHAHVKNSLVVIDTSSTTTTTLCEGADFYSSAQWSADGRKLAWIEWYHPDMPWEGAILQIADFNPITLQLSNHSHVAGEKLKIAVQQPAWLSADALIYVSDESGYFAPYLFTISSGTSQRLVPEGHLLATQDFAEPPWKLGSTSYAVLAPDSVLFTTLESGFSRFWLCNIPTNDWIKLDSPYVTIESVRGVDERTALFRGWKTDCPLDVVKLMLTPNNTLVFETIGNADGGAAATLPAVLSAPVGKSFTTAAGLVHGIFYEPRNAGYAGVEGEKPPCVVNVHGGPTGRVHPGLNWIAQYFTSRGWAWVDVNHGGSSGYGRAYRERLRGNWGIVDVDDCAAAVEQLTKENLIDPKRVIIRGGSAGGYTVLQSVVRKADIYSAATSSYGISDLRTLTEDTHKFESRYMFGLLGGTFDEVPEVYRERSPVKHADSIKTPLLILQGLIDAVVPPSQSQTIVDAIQKRGGRVKYVAFDGEGHGWRKAETIKKALEEEYAWYEEVFGWTGA